MKKLFTFLMLLVLTVPAYGSDEWLKTRPASTDQWKALPAASQANNNSLDRLLANYREGMTLSYSSATTVAVSAGEVTCSNSSGTVRKMRQNTSSTNVTFSDIDTGAEASSTTYYIYANCDADATTATFKISASSTAPTGVTHFKRLGSFYNDSSSNITSHQVTNDSNIFGSGYGAWTTKSGETTYQADTDGLVVCHGRDEGSQFAYIEGYTDSSNPPTTRRIRASGDSGVYGLTFTMPVRKGDYWKTTKNATNTLTVYWLPTGN